jgi:hypothetical protein
MNRGGLLLLFTGAVVISTLASACSSGSSGGSAGSCSAYASALRDGAKECGRFNISPAREPSYIARFEQTCQNALNAPGSGISPALLDQCSAKIRQECGDDDAKDLAM